MFTKQLKCTQCTPGRLKIVKNPDERRSLKHFKQFFLKQIVTSMIFCLINVLQCQAYLFYKPLNLLI